MTCSCPESPASPLGAAGRKTLVITIAAVENGSMTENELGAILDVTPGDHEGFERRLLEGMGHPVMVCHGPGEDHVCPLLEESMCDQVMQAHGVVFKLDLDRDYHRQILATYKQTVPNDMPIAVSVRPDQETTYADLLDGLYVWSHSPNTAELDGFAALVEAADDTRIEQD